MKSHTLIAPLSVQIELTENCTHSCRHCYCYFKQRRCTQQRLSRDQLTIIAREISDNKIKDVVITGGEPLMEIDNLLFIANELQKMPWCSVSLNSNLVLMTKKNAEQIFNTGIKSVLVSLMADIPELNDFIANKKGIWQRTISGIKSAQQAGLKVNVNMVLTKWNIDRVYETGKLVAKLGCDSFSATRACAPTVAGKEWHKNLISSEETKMSLDMLLRLKNEFGISVDIIDPYPWCILGDITKYQDFTRRRCNAGIAHCQIGPDGQIRACGPSHQKYGSIIEDGIQKIWQRMAEWREYRFSGKCLNCNFFANCGGGCTVELQHSTYQDTGIILSGDEVKNLPPEKEVDIIISPDDELQFVENLVLRDEKFGGTIFAKDSETVFLDSRSSCVVKDLQGKTFTARQLVTEGFEIEKSLITFSRWIDKKLIIIYKKKGGGNHD